MPKLLLVLLCAFLLPVGTACADSDYTTTDFQAPGSLFQVKFSQDYLLVHSSMTKDGQYVIKIDAINKSNPNWVLVEFPEKANISYTSTLAGQRWLNLNYVVEMQAYTPPPSQ